MAAIVNDTYTDVVVYADGSTQLEHDKLGYDNAFDRKAPGYVRVVDGDRQIGPSGWAYAIYAGDKEVTTDASGMGIAHIRDAETWAAMEGITEARRRFGAKVSITVVTDATSLFVMGVAYGKGMVDVTTAPDMQDAVRNSMKFAGDDFARMSVEMQNAFLAFDFTGVKVRTVRSHSEKPGRASQITPEDFRGNALVDKLAGTAMRSVKYDPRDVFVLRDAAEAAGKARRAAVAKAEVAAANAAQQTANSDRAKREAAKKAKAAEQSAAAKARKKGH